MHGCFAHWQPVLKKGLVKADHDVVGELFTFARYEILTFLST
ncbi:hypothetical protein TorRG33x02_009030 [Trema orientale]|uniref:Uncharacterized protein n=1 Tax=Trema orientale TaxID=63057 RepID=A0A2P5FYG3_TREOI|nr:hypothetical protein TorRG33x02_009030 [Trema orientale]